MAMPGFAIFLKEAKLRQLAKLIRHQEVRELYNINFPGLSEQLQYLRMANANMQSVNTILDECNLLVNRYKSDSVRSPIAGQVLGYVERCLNNALQLFRNYTLRRDYLDKMMDHHHQVFEALETLDTNNRSAVSELSNTIQDYEQTVAAYMMLNLNSHASLQFSQSMLNRGVSFDELVRTHQAHLGYRGRFENLTDEQKLEVYTEIVDVSGRFNGLTGISIAMDGVEGDIPSMAVQRSTVSFRSRGAMFGSAAMFLMDMGVIIWDVYSSGATMTEAVRAAVIAAAEAGGAALGTVVGAAVAKMVGITAASVFAVAIGLIFSFIGAFIVGAVAGIVFDAIFNSGGEKEVPEQNSRVYVSEMPDGHILARRIYSS